MLGGVFYISTRIEWSRSDTDTQRDPCREIDKMASDILPYQNVWWDGATAVMCGSLFHAREMVSLASAALAVLFLPPPYHPSPPTTSSPYLLLFLLLQVRSEQAEVRQTGGPATWSESRLEAARHHINQAPS